MIETLRTGSAPGVSIPTSAWPPSWYAVRRRSSTLIITWRSPPSTMRSSESDAARVHAKNRLSAVSVRRLDCDTAVEPPRSKECLVEHVGPVRRRQDDHGRRRIKTVHLREDLVERLLPLVVAAAEPGDAARTRAP